MIFFTEWKYAIQYTFAPSGCSEFQSFPRDEIVWNNELFIYFRNMYALWKGISRSNYSDVTRLKAI